MAITTDFTVSRISAGDMPGLAVKGFGYEGLRATINADLPTDDRWEVRGGQDGYCDFDDNPMKTFTRTLYTIINSRLFTTTAGLYVNLGMVKAIFS